LGFVYQVSSPTPPSSEVLKITEQAAAGQDQGPANSVADETDERSRASVLQKASMFEKAAAAAAPTADRPHTISTAYEKGHQRPPLTVYTFQNPETIHESGSCLNNGTAAPNGQPLSGQATPATQKSPAASLSRPPLPVVSMD